MAEAGTEADRSSGARSDTGGAVASISVSPSNVVTTAPVAPVAQVAEAEAAASPSTSTTPSATVPGPKAPAPNNVTPGARSYAVAGPSGNNSSRPSQELGPVLVDDSNMPDLSKYSHQQIVGQIHKGWDLLLDGLRGKVTNPATRRCKCWT